MYLMISHLSHQLLRASLKKYFPISYMSQKLKPYSVSKDLSAITIWRMIELMSTKI